MDSTSAVRPRVDPSDCDQPSRVDKDGNGFDAGSMKTDEARAGGLQDNSARRLSLRLYGPIRDPIAEVERQLSLELQSPYESLMPVLRHGTQLGGKRLRPAMLLLAGAAVGELTAQHVVLGTVIELVHTATLVHDDVLDDAATRRHVATVNASWNEHTSILLGDYLFAQSFRLAATLPSTEACRWIGEAARRVCEGELRQVLQRDMIELDEATYLDIIRCKTAELCRVACQLGAKHSGGNDSAVDALGVYGNAVGIAFQIADDYLDLWGEDETAGKTLGSDIGQGKMTLPMIRMLATASDHDRARMVRILKGPTEHRLQRIRPYLEQSDARQYTHRVAERFSREAIDALTVLGNTQARQSLLAIADFSVDRRF